MPHSTHTSYPTAVDATDYIVVVSNEDDYHAGYHHFADKVNRKLKAGYQLHGPPFCVKQALCQAMMRPGDNSHGNGSTVYVKEPTGHRR